VAGNPPTIATLKGILAAFNAHDLDGVMQFFFEDCVLEMPRGPDPWGTRYVGCSAVKEGLRSRFAGIPDAHYGDDTHVICDRNIALDAARNVDQRRAHGSQWL
jgi:ketosteroid isomerase-like protein